MTVGDKIGPTTVLQLLKNKHGQKCAMVRCECGAEILRIPARARLGMTCRKCSLRAHGRTSFGGYRHVDYYVAYPSRCAVRYAALADCSIYEAALVFDVNPGAVWNAWERMYPNLPQPIGDGRRRTRRSEDVLAERVERRAA